MSKILLVASDTENERLDYFLSQETEYSRTQIHALIQEGNVTVNGIIKKASYRVLEGDNIEYIPPEVKMLDILPEEIPLDVVYEDEDIIAVNKERGMIVHPSGNITSGTLVNALLFYSSSLSDINGVLRPGIVHRLDKDTTGLLLVAKNQRAHVSLQHQFKNRSINKYYYALIHGSFRDNSGVIELPIARSKRDRKKMAVDTLGRPSITKYEEVSNYPGYSFVRVELLTGRTHQIRVHFSHLGHPIVGDPTYSHQKNEFQVGGQLLHSFSIEFDHPRTGERMKLTSDLPDDFKRVIRILENKTDKI